MLRNTIKAASIEAALIILCLQQLENLEVNSLEVFVT